VRVIKVARSPPHPHTPGLGSTDPCPDPFAEELPLVLRYARKDIPQQPPGSLIQKVVELFFSADQDQFYKERNANANLTEYTGKVSVVVRAENADGFDRAKLQTGLPEPLR